MGLPEQMSDLTPIPESFRWITWEIGEAELQKSVMAFETFEALTAGETTSSGYEIGSAENPS